MGKEPTSDAAPASAIRRRITLFRTERDPRHLTDRQAEAELAAAMTAAVRTGRAGKPEYDVATLAELTRFRFLRGVVSGTALGQVEADAAVGFFLGLRQMSPGLVPAEVADIVGDLATNAGHRLRWAVECAGRRLALFDGTDIGFLDRAIDGVLWALGTASPDSVGRVLALGCLGQAYHQRYKATGDLADGRKAVSARREAVLLSPAGRDRARRLSLLADALLAVFEETGEGACLEEVIRSLEESIATTPPGDQFLWLRHDRLGRAYRHLAETTDSPADFDAAVRSGRVAREMIDVSDTDYESVLTALDRSLRARFANSRDRADLDEAVALWRTTLARMPRNDVRRADFLRALSDSLHHRFDNDGDPTDLDGSVQACEAAIAQATEDGPSRARALSDLCYRLRRRFEHARDLADLRRAVQVGRLAVTLTSLPDEGGGMVTYSNLLHATIAWYDRARDLSCLDEAIDLWTTVLAATSADCAELGARLAGKLHALELRFEHTGERSDLDQVFVAARECLAVAQPEVGEAAETLLRVAHRLDSRAAEADRSINVGLQIDNARFSVRSRSAADLDAMNTLVDLARSIAPHTADDEADREIRQWFLAMALAVRYPVTGRAEDGAESVRVMKSVAAAAGPDDPQRSVYLSNLGDILVSRFLRDGDAADLDAAVEAHMRAFRKVLPDAGDRAQHLPKLSYALRLRYDDRRDPGDLERVVAVIRDAVADGYPSPDCRVASLAELTKVLLWRFDHTRDTADLDAAVTAGREAVRPNAASEAPSDTALSRLASALFTRYQQTGNAADLDEAISTLATALADMPDGDGQRLSTLHNHALLTQARAVLTGSSADFDRSVAELRDVTGARSPDDPTRWLDFNSLGIALRVRHASLGDDTDMHAAVEAHRTALREASGDPLLRAIAAFGLANVLSSVYEETSDRAVLDEAITLAAGAEHDFPEHGHAVSQALSILSWLLRMRVDLPGEPDPTDVAEMLRVSKRMIDTARPGSADHSLFLRSRAVALTTAARARRDPSLLDQAVATARQAVESTRPGDARRAEWLWSLGLILQQRHRVTGNGADQAATLACWREAARDPYGGPDMVTRCAVHAGRLAVQRGDIDGSVADYGLAVRHLPTVAWHGMRTKVRSDTLRRWSGLASEAAGAAIAAGQPATAVELLEQSRSVLWTQALNLRSDLGELARSQPALAERLTALRSQLDAFAPADRLDASSPLGEPRHLAAQADAIHGPVFSVEADERRRELARQWDETVERVRRIEGFEHFLGPTPYAELKRAARDGPVVIVNVSWHGCHALLIRDEVPEPEVVELPGVSADNVSGKTSDLLSALRVQTDPRASFLARERARHLGHDVLGWLWDDIVGPILARLENLDGTRFAELGGAPPRLWWCPVGLLSLLPLHAAGHHPRHRSATDSDGRWTADLVVSSYTPTLAALTRGRNRRPEPTVRRHLAIALQETRGMAALPAVADELAGLRRHAARTTEVVTLAGPAATQRAVLDALPRCDRIHFACHAAQDFVDPAASAFSLHDGVLSIADIAAMELDDAELAFLSACQTATGVPDLADEAIHLAAAVQLTGFRHIIATSWSVGDTSAALMSDHFYRELASSGSGAEPAMALHRAVRALRDSDPTDPVTWATYVHFGS